MVGGMYSGGGVEDRGQGTPRSPVAGLPVLPSSSFFSVLLSLLSSSLFSRIPLRFFLTSAGKLTMRYSSLLFLFCSASLSRCLLPGKGKEILGKGKRRRRGTVRRNKKGKMRRRRGVRGGGDKAEE